MLVKHGATVQDFDRKGNSSLDYASWSRCPAVLEEVLKLDQFQVNGANRMGQAPIHVAAHHGFSEMASLLLDLQADLNLREATGGVALGLASFRGHTTIVELLCKARASVDVQTSGEGVAEAVWQNCPLSPRATKAIRHHRFGATPLFGGILGGHLDVVRLLLQHKASPYQLRKQSVDRTGASGSNNNSSSNSNNNDCSNVNSKNNNNDNNNCNSSYNKSSNNSKSNKSTSIFSKGERTDSAATKGGTTTSNTASNGSNNNNNCNSSSGNSNNSSDNKEELQEEEDDDDDDRGPLSTLGLAARLGHHEVLEELCEAVTTSAAGQILLEGSTDRGGKFDASTEQSQLLEAMPPLHAAAAEGHVACVQVLIARKASLNDHCRDGGGPTRPGPAGPLHGAAADGRFEVAKLLLTHKASPLTMSDCGRTPTHIAAANGHVRVLEQIFEFCSNSAANVEANSSLKSIALPRNRRGDPVLASAAHGGHVTVVKWLCESTGQASPTSKEDLAAGADALGAAALAGHLQVLRCLFNVFGEAVLKVKCRYGGGTTPLHAAAAHGHLKAVEYLLLKKANPHMVDNFKVTPLQAAQCFGHQSMMQLLCRSKS